MDYFEVNGLLATEHFGFRRRRSTEDQLVIMHDKVARWVDQTEWQVEIQIWRINHHSINLYKKNVETTDINLQVRIQDTEIPRKS